MYQSNRAGCDCKPELNTKFALLILMLWSLALSSQVRNDFVLAEIHKRLTSSKRLTYHEPFVFIGEISRLGLVYQGVCKEAVDQQVDFTISRLLFGTHENSLVPTGYINCTKQPLPSPPFTLHAKVIVYCEQSHHYPICLTPVEYTDERLKKVESWIAAIQHGAAK